MSLNCWRVLSSAIGALLFCSLSVGSAVGSVQVSHGEWITSTNGCSLWNPHPEPKESVTWSGDCQGGKIEGPGTEQWFRDGKPGNRLEGVAHLGRIKSRVVTYPDGSRYEGELDENGTRGGRGVFISARGLRYEGEFRDGKWNGHGVLTTSDGRRIEGEWTADEMSRGSVAYPNGDKYNGELRRGRKAGFGTYTSASGGSYSGMFVDDKASGHCHFREVAGNVYEGEWRNGQLNGRVALTLFTGRRYEQEWRDGQLLGYITRREFALKRKAGVFETPVVLNETLTLDFMVDSGAADVSLPADVVSTLLRTNTLVSSDFTGQTTYTLADGSSLPAQTFTIRSLKLGSLEVRNVSASLGTVNSIPILGQSFLGRLGRWSIDNGGSVLVVEQGPTK